MTKECPFKRKEKRYRDEIIGYEDSPTGDMRYPIHKSYEINACSLRGVGSCSHMECVGEDNCPIINKCSDCLYNTANKLKLSKEMISNIINKKIRKENDYSYFFYHNLLDIIALCGVCGGFRSNNKKYHTCVCDKKKVD